MGNICSTIGIAVLFVGLDAHATDPLTKEIFNSFQTPVEGDKPLERIEGATFYPWPNSAKPAFRVRATGKGIGKCWIRDILGIDPAAFLATRGYQRMDHHSLMRKHGSGRRVETNTVTHTIDAATRPRNSEYFYAVGNLPRGSRLVIANQAIRVNRQATSYAGDPIPEGKFVLVKVCRENGTHQRTTTRMSAPVTPSRTYTGGGSRQARR